MVIAVQTDEQSKSMMILVIGNIEQSWVAMGSFGQDLEPWAIVGSHG